MKNYVIISPVKNEEMFIEHTINSVVNQTFLPEKWIIVNDGSTDRTREIIEKSSQKYSFIIPINRQNKQKIKRKRGQGVIEAFYAGFKTIQNENFEYIVKLDGDLLLPPDFFEKIFEQFRIDPKLGIASGISFAKKNGKWIREWASKGYTYGETKVYRKQCFEDIGGLVPHMGWDGIDHIKAVMKGWKASGFEDIIFYHLRPEGTGTGIIKSAYEEGICCHYMGYHPLFFILRSCKRMLSYPLFFGGLAMILSYLKCKIAGEKKIEDDNFISFLRKNQIKRVLSRNSEYTPQQS